LRLQLTVAFYFYLFIYYFIIIIIIFFFSSSADWGKGWNGTLTWWRVNCHNDLRRCRFNLLDINLTVFVNVFTPG